MKKQFNQLTRKLMLTAGLLSMWSMLCGFLIQKLDLDFPVLAIILNILIIILSLWQPFRYISWISLLFSAIQYTTVIIISHGFSNQLFITSGICFVILLFTKFFSSSLRHQIWLFKHQLHEQGDLIDSMTMVDRKTDLIKWRFAKNILMREVAHSQRINGQLSLILFEVQSKEQYASSELENIDKIFTEVIHDVIRTDIDIPYIGDYIGLILPERDLGFSQEFSELIIQMVQQNIEAHISAGIANFPLDAHTTKELVNRATLALWDALSSGQTFVSYHSPIDKIEQGEIIERTDITQATTYPDNLGARRYLLQDYENILTNIHLEENEWIIWLRGFGRLEDLKKSKNSLHKMEHITRIKLLFVQANHLVVRVKTNLANLNGNEQPFPGWIIKKVNVRNHFLLLHQSEE